MPLTYRYRFPLAAGVLLVFVASFVANSLLHAKQTLPSTKASPSSKPKLAPRSDYVGDQACSPCHKAKFDSYEKTAHQATSQVVRQDAIVGTFTPGENTMATLNPNLSFEMVKKGDEFFQTAIWASPSAAPRKHTERLDLVVGSGRRGQTYLYWRDNQLFQLPVSYSTDLRRWIMSPGYMDDQADFERPIIPRCLECHATYFDSLFPDPQANLYKTQNYVLGISCERCHGPGRAHAASSQAKSPAPAATIVNPAKLSPARQAEVCAQCHAGQGQRFLAPAFSYIPGQPLDQYIDLGAIDATKDVDVHGKQGALLVKSRCYKMSANLNCFTCHNVHEQQRDLAAMSQRCLRCHQPQPSATHAKLGDAITQNCIDCHMPMLESKAVYINVDGKKVHPRLRTHWIKVYSDQERQ